jgi:beta-lactam-binding protein with PASTA domain
MEKDSVLPDVLRAVFIFSVALILLLAVSFFITRLLVRGKEVAVPEVTGMSFLEAYDILTENGLRVRKEGYKYSADLPENYVVEQRPASNQKVKVDREIKVFLSRGTEDETVPRLIGQTISEAESILKSIGLEAGSIVRVHSDDFPQEGAIIAHTPPGNATIQRGSKVNLLVSLGPHSVGSVMPDLVGMKLQNAQETLESMGLKAGRVVRKDSPVVEEAGIVLEQMPQPGEPAERGITVDLVVSSGGEPKETPRTVVLPYRVPPRPVSSEYPEQQDLSPRHVKIVVEHGGGTWTPVDGMLTPGDYTAPLRIIGRGIAKIYVDDMESPVAHEEL